MDAVEIYELDDEHLGFTKFMYQLGMGSDIVFMIYFLKIQK